MATLPPHLVTPTGNLPLRGLRPDDVLPICQRHGPLIADLIDRFVRIGPDGSTSVEPEDFPALQAALMHSALPLVFTIIAHAADIPNDEDRVQSASFFSLVNALDQIGDLSVNALVDVDLVDVGLCLAAAALPHSAITNRHRH